MGHWQGLSVAPGASFLNLLTWNRDIASAMLLLIYGMCLAIIEVEDILQSDPHSIVDAAIGYSSLKAIGSWSLSLNFLS